MERHLHFSMLMGNFTFFILLNFHSIVFGSTPNLPCHTVNIIQNAPSNNLVDQIKLALNKENGPGFITLNTAEWFPVEWSEQFFQEVADLKFLSVKNTSAENRDGRVINFSEHYNPWISEMGRWLQRLLNEAVGNDFKLTAPQVELRKLAEGSQESNRQNLSWHADAGTFTVIVSLKGPSTEYLDPKLFDTSEVQDFTKIHPPNSAIRSPYRGEILIFSNLGRKYLKHSGAPLIHRSPNIPSDRLVLIFRFG